jgi:branched-chain amino acid transport system substrate-binding protein
MSLQKQTRVIVSAMAMTIALFGPAMADKLKVGIIAPLTGPGAAWGMAGKMAGEILAGSINAKGGLDVGGKKYDVEVIAYDDQYKANEAVAAYNRLVNENGVKYIIIATSAPTMALKQMVEDDKIIALTSSYTPAAINENTKFMFRLYSTSKEFMPGYVAWMKHNLSERKLITLNPNDETGWAHSQITTAAYKGAGLEVIGSETYERSAKDFAPLLTKVLALKPELIDLGSSSPATAGLIVRQARELGFKGRFVQTGGAGWADIVAAAGKQGAEGLVNMLYADPQNPGYKALVEEYTKKIGQAPNEIIAPYYDAYNVLLHAIQKAGDVGNTEKVAAAFPQVLPMKSLQGDDIDWAHQQFRTYDYVGMLTDGVPVVKDKVR